MSDAQWIGVALALWFLLTLYSAVKAYKKLGFKFALFKIKRQLDGWKMTIALIIGWYGVLGGVFVMPAIMQFANAQKVSSELGTILIHDGIPIVWGIAILYYVYLVMFKWAFRPFFKYSEQEKQWHREDKGDVVYQWLKAKFPKIIKDSEL